MKSKNKQSILDGNLRIEAKKGKKSEMSDIMIHLCLSDFSYTNTSLNHCVNADILLMRCVAGSITDKPGI